MRRREFITLLTGAAAGWPLPAHAQAPKNTPRVCFLTFDPATSRSTRFDAFFQGLADLGYVDGKTVTIDYLSADGDGERFPSLAAECLRLKADLIAASTTPATQAAKKATPTTPIVMIGLGDPVGTGLVNSLAKPGGNVTGMSMMVPEVATKRLELLKEAVPGISRALCIVVSCGARAGDLRAFPSSRRPAHRMTCCFTRVHESLRGRNCPFVGTAGCRSWRNSKFNENRLRQQSRHQVTKPDD